MAKFKKGDRVRCITPTSNGCLKGHIGTLIRDPEGDLSGGNIYLDTFKHCAGLGDYFELLTEYTPITPKVGERYRCIKPYGGVQVGNEYIVRGVYPGTVSPADFGYEHGRITSNHLTTEYLELVEGVRGESITVISDNIDSIGDKEPIKKTIIQKTMNAFKKALLSADTKTLIKAGYMDDETLELTSKGQQALNFIVYEKYQKELVAAAEADIKEEEAKKK